jgi:hypothetical protein
MFRKWHFLALVPAFALAVVACDEAPTQPEPFVPDISAGVDANEWYEFTGEYQDPCTGEWYDYEMQNHYVSYIHFDANGGVHVRVHENAKYKGVGRDTGIKYVGNWSFGWTVNNPPHDGWAVSQRIVDHAVSQGPAPNTREMIYDIHWTMNANGETTSYWRELYDVVCTG